MSPRPATSWRLQRKQGAKSRGRHSIADRIAGAVARRGGLSIAGWRKIAQEADALQLSPRNCPPLCPSTANLADACRSRHGRRSRRNFDPQLPEIACEPILDSRPARLDEFVDARSMIYEIDLHGYHPDDVCGQPLKRMIEQVWETGAEGIRFIHGHGHMRGKSVGFVNTNTGYFGLRIRSQ